MSFMSIFAQLLGSDHMEGRVQALHARFTPQVLPRCESCGFGTMRVLRPTCDPFEVKLDVGQTRLRCDRTDCASVVIANSRDVVPA